MQVPSRILVIDDDPLNNMLCKLIIRSAFAEVDVHTFISPEKGLEYIKSEYADSHGNRPDILFLDINMPVLDGWEVLDALSHLREELKARLTIFMLSSSVDQKDKAQAASNPMVSGFLSKPLTKDNLFQLFPART